MVKFGLLYELSVPKPWNDRSEYDTWWEAIKQVVLAEELGWDYVWIVEHHFLEELSSSSAPEVWLSTVSQHTSRIRIGHGVVLLPMPFNHPIRVAERIAALDIVSNGRVEFGTGRGISIEEHAGFDMDPAQTKAMWREAISIIPKMWATDRFSYEGKYVRIPPRNILPKPIQKPHPPMWVACGSDETYGIAGDLGLGALCFSVMNPETLGPKVATYKRRIKDAKPVGQFVNNQAALNTIMYCDETNEKAMAIGAPGATFYISQSFKHQFEARGLAKFDPNMDWDPERLMRRVRTEGGVAVGNPDTVGRQMERIIAQGADQVMFNIQTGKIPHDKIMKSLRLFAKEVMPRFK